MWRWRRSHCSFDWMRSILCRSICKIVYQERICRRRQARAGNATTFSAPTCLGPGNQRQHGADSVPRAGGRRDYRAAAWLTRRHASAPTGRPRHCLLISTESGRYSARSAPTHCCAGCRCRYYRTWPQKSLALVDNSRRRYNFLRREKDANPAPLLDESGRF